jgi:hypothetical protein
MLTTCLYLEEAAHECVSEDALVHLKSYKYSSVDKSFISNYILKHYVCRTTFKPLGIFTEKNIVECICGITAIMACAKYGHFIGIFLHSFKCYMFGDIHAGFGGTSMF